MFVSSTVNPSAVVRGASRGQTLGASRDQTSSLVFDRSDRRETSIPVTSAEAARRAVVKLNLNMRIFHSSFWEVGTVSVQDAPSISPQQECC